MPAGRSLVVIAGGVGILLIVGIIVAVAGGRQPEARYPAGSPQGRVATYLRLLQDGQVDKAYALTALDGDGSSMEPAITLQRFHLQYDQWSQRSHRVILVRSSVAGGSASVTVDISAFSGGAFGASDTTNRQTFTLIRHAGAWRITGPQYVWP